MAWTSPFLLLLEPRNEASQIEYKVLVLYKTWIKMEWKKSIHSKDEEAVHVDRNYTNLSTCPDFDHTYSIPATKTR